MNVRSCVDLSLLAKSVDNARWKGKYRRVYLLFCVCLKLIFPQTSNPIGLARLIAAYEDRLLTKGKVTRSNWENYLDSSQQECTQLSQLIPGLTVAQTPAMVCQDSPRSLGPILTSSDGYAGYTLYTRLSRMVPSMQKPPLPRCYTFDAIRGRLCEPTGMTWAPFNADYDPGPPPPPRPESSVSTGAAATSSEPFKGFRSKRPRAPQAGSPPSVRPPPTLARNQEAGDTVPTPVVKQKRHRIRPRKPTTQ